MGKRSPPVIVTPTMAVSQATFIDYCYGSVHTVASPGSGSRAGTKPIHETFLLQRARIASAVLARAIPSVRPSVCLSVCPSVTRRYCVKTTARSTVQFAPLDSKMCLVL